MTAVTVAHWDICDVDGAYLATHYRRDPDKKIWWEPTGTSARDLPLYRSHLVYGLPRTAPLLLTEGERDCDALATIGIDAVGTVTGASSCPTPDALRPLAEGRTFVLWPDYDAVGRKHMRAVSDALRVAGAETVLILDYQPTACEWKAGAGALDFIRPLVNLHDASTVIDSYAIARDAVAMLVESWAAPAPPMAPPAPAPVRVSWYPPKTGGQLLTLDVLLGSLEGAKRSGGGWVARCPAHEDRHASLSVTEAPDGKLLVRCFAGCSFDDIRRAVR